MKVEKAVSRISDTGSRTTGKRLALEWGVDTRHALYHREGTWYHLPKIFPAHLFDPNGYLEFKTLEDYRIFVVSEERTKEYAEKNILSVASGISASKSYNKFPALISNPEEILDVSSLSEGTTMRVFVNRYERNPLARKKCLDHWGTTCAACLINLGDKYGAIAEGFIEVHHLTAVSSIRAKYKIDPIRDLRPVCPNCHAIIHRKNPHLTLDEVKVLLDSTKPKVRTS